MNKWILIIAILATFGFNAYFEKSKNNQMETIVFLRHAEKPLLDFGQLTCQGLNRSLALPKVLNNKFGRPNYIFASDPYWEGYYYYVRALVTIEPAAIELGMPVNVAYKFLDVDNVARELITPQYHESLLFVAWEHINIVLIAKKILKLLNADPDLIPPWPQSDYDSLYVISIDWNSMPPKLFFKHEQQGLNDQSKTCPETRSNSNQTTLGTETFVFIPEAEPISDGHDQLSCQGLNRALALPKVLASVYPTINLFVLPAPVGVSYFRRALMTIEPTIINRGSLFIPEGSHGIEDAVGYLKSDDCLNQTTAIVWPLYDLANLAQALYKEYGGNPKDIPNPVPSSDTIYQITVVHSARHPMAAFKMVQEHLDPQPKTCTQTS